MKVLQETIGEATILIETMLPDVEILNKTQVEPKIIDTGLTDDIKGKYIAFLNHL